MPTGLSAMLLTGALVSPAGVPCVQDGTLGSECTGAGSVGGTETGLMLSRPFGAVVPVDHTGGGYPVFGLVFDGKPAKTHFAGSEPFVTAPQRVADLSAGQSARWVGGARRGIPYVAPERKAPKGVPTPVWKLIDGAFADLVYPEPESPWGRGRQPRSSLPGYVHQPKIPFRERRTRSARIQWAKDALIGLVQQELAKVEGGTLNPVQLLGLERTVKEAITIIGEQIAGEFEDYGARAWAFAHDVSGNEYQSHWARFDGADTRLVPKIWANQSEWARGAMELQRYTAESVRAAKQLSLSIHRMRSVLDVYWSERNWRIATAMEDRVISPDEADRTRRRIRELRLQDPSLSEQAAEHDALLEIYRERYQAMRDRDMSDRDVATVLNAQRDRSILYTEYSGGLLYEYLAEDGRSAYDAEEAMAWALTWKERGIWDFQANMKSWKGTRWAEGETEVPPLLELADVRKGVTGETPGAHLAYQAIDKMLEVAMADEVERRQSNNTRLAIAAGVACGVSLAAGRPVLAMLLCSGGGVPAAWESTQLGLKRGPAEAGWMAGVVSLGELEKIEDAFWNSIPPTMVEWMLIAGDVVAVAKMVLQLRKAALATGDLTEAQRFSEAFAAAQAKCGGDPTCVEDALRGQGLLVTPPAGSTAGNGGVDEVVTEICGRRPDVAGCPTAAGQGGRPRAVDGAEGEQCFSEGTLVHTPSGPRPIEKLKPGDLVLTRSDVDSLPVPRPVERTFITPGKAVLRMTLRSASGADDVLRVTHEHPFYVEEKGWTAAVDVRLGDRIAGAAGSLTAVAFEAEPQLVTVYNLQVAEHHTYFVGESQAWVHNTCRVIERQNVRGAAFFAEGGGAEPRKLFSYQKREGEAPLGKRTKMSIEIEGLRYDVYVVESAGETFTLHVPAHIPESDPFVQRLLELAEAGSPDRVRDLYRMLNEGPRLTGEGAAAMYRQLGQDLHALPLNTADRARYFRRGLEQIPTGGSHPFRLKAEVAGDDGSRVFVSDADEVFVVGPNGNLFFGRVNPAGAQRVDYNRLTPLLQPGPSSDLTAVALESLRGLPHTVAAREARFRQLARQIPSMRHSEVRELPDGSLVVEGTDGTLLRLSADGSVAASSIAPETTAGMVGSRTYRPSTPRDFRQQDRQLAFLAAVKRGAGPDELIERLASLGISATYNSRLNALMIRDAADGPLNEILARLVTNEQRGAPEINLVWPLDSTTALPLGTVRVDASMLARAANGDTAELLFQIGRARGLRPRGWPTNPARLSIGSIELRVPVEVDGRPSAESFYGADVLTARRLGDVAPVPGRRAGVTELGTARAGRQWAEDYQLRAYLDAKRIRDALREVANGPLNPRVVEQDAFTEVSFSAGINGPSIVVRLPKRPGGYTDQDVREFSNFYVNRSLSQLEATLAQLQDVAARMNWNFPLE